MARIWARGDLQSIGGGVWEIPFIPASAIVTLFHNGMRLREVAVAPGVLQYTRSGTLFTLITPGLDPEVGADFWFIWSDETEVAILEGVGAAQAYLTRFNETFYYQVFVKDLEGNLKAILSDQVDGISWSYGAVGGCLDAQITLRRPFDDLRNLDEDYQIEIWRDVDKLGQAGAMLPIFLTANGFQLGTSHVGVRELRWGGYIGKLEPTLDEYEHVALHCYGWTQHLERLGVANLDVNGIPEPYMNMDVGAIVRDIIDTWAIPGSRIKRTAAFGLVPDCGIIAGNIFFYGTIADALRTLANMAGDAEWGVRADGEFFFVQRSQIVKQTWAIGHKVKLYQPLKNSDDVVNRVYLQGASGLRAVINLGSFQAKNQKERFITVGSIATANEAALWAIGYSTKFGPGVPVSQRLSGRVKLGATAKQIEGVGVPLGLFRIVGGPIFVAGGDRLAAQLDIELANVYGGITDQSFRINTITYTMQEDNYDIDIELGARSNPIADRLSSIEYKLSELRQAQQ